MSDRFLVEGAHFSLCAFLEPRPGSFAGAAPFGDNTAPFRSPALHNLAMNLHEYQSKALFAEYGIPVPKGIAVKTAAEAKEAALKKFTERKADDDPAVLARKAARLEAAKAREARAAERKAKKLEEKARLIEEQARKKAEAELEAAKKAERQEALAAEQKAARDARYAARAAKQ